MAHGSVPQFFGSIWKVKTEVSTRRVKEKKGQAIASFGMVHAAYIQKNWRAALAHGIQRSCKGPRQIEVVQPVRVFVGGRPLEMTRNISRAETSSLCLWLFSFAAS